MMVAIRDSIVMKLAANFPGHKIYDEQVKQGLIRPCFFVDLIPVALEKKSPNIQERSMFIDIQFMSLEDTKQKNLDMAERLGQLFSTVEFSGFRVNVTDERYEIIDGILHYLFDLDFMVLGSDDTIEPLIGRVSINEEVI